MRLTNPARLMEPLSAQPNSEGVLSAAFRRRALVVPQFQPQGGRVRASIARSC